MPYLIIGVCLAAALLILRAALGDVSGIARVELGFSSITGNRQINADVFDWAYYREEILLALADGTGSGTKGRTAAKAAAYTATRVFEVTGAGDNPSFFFRQAFGGANATVLRYIPDATAGASLLCAAIQRGRLYYALAGNCKILVYRNRELIPLSEGHSIDVLARQAYERRQISREDALEAVKEKRVYNFVGKDGFRDVELFDLPVTLKRDDVIVLMTDGVYEYMTGKQVEDILQEGWDCEHMAKRITGLLDGANHPEQDNATVILARVNAI